MKQNIAGLELTLDNAREVIHMGGPFICDVWLNDKLIVRKCLCENFVYDSARDYLYFAQYHKVNHYQYFTINFYQPTTSLTFQFSREFRMLYLGALLNDHEMEIYFASHDKLPQSKFVFNFDNEDFILIEHLS